MQVSLAAGFTSRTLPPQRTRSPTPAPPPSRTMLGVTVERLSARSAWGMVVQPASERERSNAIRTIRTQTPTEAWFEAPSKTGRYSDGLRNL